MKWKNIATGANTFFITATIQKWQPLFAYEIPRKILVDDILFYSSKHQATIHAYVIMPDHYHLLISFQDSSCLHSWLRDVHSHSAKEISGWLNSCLSMPEVRIHEISKAFSDQLNDKRALTIWKEKARAVGITSTKILQRKIEYIHANPVRGGFVADPGDWEYSSWGIYHDDVPGDISVERISM